MTNGRIVANRRIPHKRDNRFSHTIYVFEYAMISGTVYKGDFDDGSCHGTGTAYYASGSRIEGVWERGVCVERNYILSDGLRFRPDNWRYCEMPDRRYAYARRTTVGFRDRFFFFFFIDFSYEIITEA